MEIKYILIGLVAGVVAGFLLRKQNVPVATGTASQLRSM